MAFVLPDKFPNLIEISEINDFISTYKPYGFFLHKIFNKQDLQFIKNKDGMACYILDIAYKRIALFDEGENKVIFDRETIPSKELSEILLNLESYEN